MKKLTKTILVSSLALAVGCVSRIDIEQWTLEPCDGATTAEIARLVEEGASRDGRVWNRNIPYEAVRSPSYPDSVFLYNKNVACYRLLRKTVPGVGNLNVNERSEQK